MSASTWPPTHRHLSMAGQPHGVVDATIRPFLGRSGRPGVDTRRMLDLPGACFMRLLASIGDHGALWMIMIFFLKY
jgi:hypothetical protein